MRPLIALALAAPVACSSSSAISHDSADAAAPDAPTLDARVTETSPADSAGDVDKAAPCAKTFGTSLTNAFGRVDGTVIAVVPPNGQACALPNSTHLVVQVLFAGSVYRMVVDVLSDSGDPNVFFYELDAPLAAGDWSEGWHPGVTFDYVTTLGVHSTAFTSFVENDLVAKISAEIALGAHISFFATSDGEPNSAHLVHRNLTDADGAIVAQPDSSHPHYLLMHFDEQSF